jgi:branched-chain amino acid transport system ATP-binding protein
MNDGDALLDVVDLSLAFGGVDALRRVTFQVDDGELVGLIGPNGAGKTSLFNCINGVYRPQEGSLCFGGRELLGLRPSSIAALGIARTFQNLALFGNLDITENLMLGRHLLMRTGFLTGALWFGRARREEVAHRQRCSEIVDLLGLGAHCNRPVGLLPHGIQKRIELGRALAMEPRLVLLDEPAAGLNSEETDALGDLIVDIQHELRLAMILIEHDMHMVMDLAERLVVLDFGEVIASGTPAEVATDAAVVTAYLGHSEVVQ